MLVPIVVALWLGAPPAPVHGAGVVVSDPVGCLGAVAPTLPPGFEVRVEVARAARGGLRLIVQMRQNHDAAGGEVLSRERGLWPIDCPHAARLVAAWVEAALAERAAPEPSSETEPASEPAPVPTSVPASAPADSRPGASPEESPPASSPADDPVVGAVARVVRLRVPRAAVTEVGLGVSLRVGREVALGLGLDLGVREGRWRVSVGPEVSLVRTETAWDTLGVGLGLGLGWRPWAAPVRIGIGIDAGARGGVGASPAGVVGVVGVGLGVVWEDLFGGSSSLSLGGRWAVIRAGAPGDGEGVLQAGLGFAMRLGGGP